MPPKSGPKATKTVVNDGKVTKPAAPPGNKKLPLARVKKIAKMDEDVVALSNAAALVIAGATEKFAAYFAEQSFFYTLADKKKVLDYKHCASAVARLPQLDFLADVVPQTVKLSETAEWKRLEALRKKDETQDKGAGVPDWAKAHPEVSAKIKAAQAEQDKVKASTAHEMNPASSSLSDDNENDDTAQRMDVEKILTNGADIVAPKPAEKEDADMTYTVEIEVT